MKLAVSSTAGPPRAPHTWSNAPAHLISVLEGLGHEVLAIDTALLTRADKAALAVENLARRRPWNAVGWFETARRRRGRYVAQRARSAGCDIVICTGTLDAPLDMQIDYAIWLDNTFALLQRSAVALPYPAHVVSEIERLERAALEGARMVLPFSEHVRDSVIADYGLPAERVCAIGCGSGPLPIFNGEKSFSEGHLLFVAKHLFSSKGGELLLEAFRLISDARPKTKLIIVGNEEACNKATGIQGVEVHGFVERETLNDFFAGASMLVQPMLADPWGQVYLEAMKARSVVVALNVGAVPELLDGGRLGVVVDRPDARALADAVLATYARPQIELDTMTREAQALAVGRYSWSAVGLRMSSALRLASI